MQMDFAEKKFNTKFGQARLLFNGFAPLSFYIEVQNAVVNGVEYRTAYYRGTYNAHTGVVEPSSYSEPSLHRSDFKDASEAAKKTVRNYFDEVIPKIVREDVEFMRQTADALHKYSIDRLQRQIDTKREERDKLSKEIGELEQEHAKIMLAGPPTLLECAGTKPVLITSAKAAGRPKMRTWTGGSTPTNADKAKPEFRALRSELFREQLRQCGGLDFWKCAGTSCIERARIFWNRATLDAWATLR
jgi:hypothetical protein